MFGKINSIAILLAAHNANNFIKEQVKSLLNQKNVYLDIFVSIDLSTDTTYEYFKKLSLNNENIKILPYGDVFGSAAPNFYRLISDVDFSDYNFIAFADQDDIWDDNKLHRAIQILEHSNVDVWSSNVTAFWPDGRKQLIDKAQPQRNLDYFFEAAGPGCTYVFKKKFMLEFQKFIKNLPNAKKIILHDWMAYAFCRERNYKWHIDPIPSMLYRQHNNNQIGANSDLKNYKKRFAMIQSKNYRKQVEFLASIIAPEKLKFISNRWWLLKNFKHLRRRKRDRYFLALMLFLGIY